MQNVEQAELEGLFESLSDNDDKIDVHNQTIKMIKADSSDRIKDFAKEKECKPKDVTDAYKYYVKRSKKGEAVNEDYFTLCAMVDAMTEDDAEGEESNS